MSALAHSDMEGIDPNIMSHRLNIDPGRKPIRKKKDELWMQSVTKP